MARNLTRGGGKAVQSAVVGLRELEAKLRALNPKKGSEMADDIQFVVAEAAGEARNAMRSSARAAGWPEPVIASIFSYGKPRPGGNDNPSALAGVNKHWTELVWRAGKHPKSPRAKVKPGGWVAMSRATMLEFGTTRNPAKPAIRPALKLVRPIVIAKVKAGFKAILAKFTK